MKHFAFLIALLFGMASSGTFAQNTACEGTSTAAAEGTFTLGYTYNFSTNGNNVIAVFQLLDPKEGLVAFSQTYNPNFAEVQMTPVGEPGSQTFSITYTGQTLGASFNMACKFAFAGGLATTPVFSYTVGDDCGGSTVLELPVNFENENIDYELQDFGGNVSEIVVDPTNPSNKVVQSTKTATAELWAGTTVGDVTGFAQPVPFSPGSTTMTVRVWSPTSGTPIRLKVEQVGAPTISVETEATTTVAMAWETLTFDFTNQAAGTAALNFASTYNKASMFFNFGTTGAAAGEQTYYWDDLEFVGAEVMDLPVNFENPDLDYGLVDFGGNESELVVDPTDAGNTVVQSTKTPGAATWAGTTLGEGVGFANPIPFEPGVTAMTVRVWSPQAGIQVRLKAEALTNPTISVETEATVTEANVWQTLTFDFANEAAGTAALNFASIYSKASIFFNFGVEGTGLTYYWDDVQMAEGTPPPVGLSLPVTFEEDIDYGLTDFGGNASEIVVDPTDASNMVAQSIKTAGAELWAGTTIGGTTGFSTPVPFAPGNTNMTVRVWSPTAGTPIRLKAEQSGNPTISVETEALTTVAMQWETLTFNFANQAAGTAPINYNNNYNLVSIFFNFGTTGAQAGEQTYYWDDVAFGGDTPPGEGLLLPVTFEEDIDYGLADFGGNNSEIVTDPTDPNNTVVQSIKTAAAELWAGTTVGEGIGFASAFPFEPGATTMSVRVWSPLAGIPVRLKAENLTNPTISVETEATTTVANGWQTMVFDFANEAPGTAAINFGSVYTKVSIFFNFGTPGSTTGELTYYWDDVDFGSGSVTPTTVYGIIAGSPDHTILKSVLDLTGLNAALVGEGPFTVFAPTDAAFNAVPADILADLLDDPSGNLTQVLLYHVLGAQVLSGDLTDGQTAETLQGEDITVTFGNDGILINQALVTAPDLLADNGVVHVIDGVLLPPGLGINTRNTIQDLGVKIFPNPSTDYVQISFTEANDASAMFWLYDLNGKVVKQANIVGLDQRITVTELPAGTYILRLSLNGKQALHKMMIAK